jgi:hypothetical protein
MMPAINPESGGAPEASAIPKQSGRATKKTTSDAGASCEIERNIKNKLRKETKEKGRPDMTPTFCATRVPQSKISFYDLGG